LQAKSSQARKADLRTRSSFHTIYIPTHTNGCAKGADYISFVTVNRSNHILDHLMMSAEASPLFYAIIVTPDRFKD